jgi:hypothetical protein
MTGLYWATNGVNDHPASTLTGGRRPVARLGDQSG